MIVKEIGEKTITIHGCLKMLRKAIFCLPLKLNQSPGGHFVGRARKEKGTFFLPISSQI